tara:strand:- start:120 stop:1391 length:1272 start_codon:yes stop_codon:yes gene_type:complete
MTRRGQCGDKLDNFEPVGNLVGNLRSQPTLWHLIRKNLHGDDECFSCGYEDESMELHEEWAHEKNNDDIVLMGLFWLCSHCHDYISNRGKWGLSRAEGPLQPFIIDNDEAIQEATERDDYQERFELFFYDGIGLSEPYLIDHKHPDSARWAASISTSTKIRASSQYSSILNSPPLPSESGGGIIVSHVLSGIISDEQIEYYQRGIIYGRHWYYRYYGDNFAFDFQLAHRLGDMPEPVWMNDEKNYVKHGDTFYAKPAYSDYGYSRKQILHFASVFVRKYGDFPPSTLFGPASRPYPGIGNFEQRHSSPGRIMLPQKLLAYSILHNMKPPRNGFGEVREALGLPRTHGQAGPYGHPYRIVLETKTCSCGKRVSSRNKHKENCDILSNIWDKAMEREFVEDSIKDLNLDEFILTPEEWSRTYSED